MSKVFIEDSELQSSGFGFDLGEAPWHLFDLEEKVPSHDDAREALVFSELSDSGILDDVVSGGTDANEADELIEPLQAEPLSITEELEPEKEESADLAEEEDTDSDEEYFLNPDDDTFTLVVDLENEDADGSDPVSDEPEVPNVIGTDDDDVFVGGSAADTILGLGGNDHLDGGAGDDTIVGYAGNDILIGGNGADNFSGGSDGDQIYGGDGNDDISGDDGDDTLFGGDDDDTIEGGAGNDTLYGGAGDDFYLWQRGDGDDLVIDEGQSGSNVLELAGVTSDQVQFKEMENGDWQLIIAASAPDADDGGIITFQAGSFESFASLQFFNPVPLTDMEYGACG